MNKEYIRIDKDLIYVTNENGKLKDRRIVKNMQKILVSENKLEYINNLLDELNKELTDDKEVLDFIKVWKLVHKFLIIIFFFIAVATIFLQSKTEMFTIWFVYTIAINTFSNIIKNNKQSKISGITEEIKLANEIRKDFEKEFENIKTLEDETDNYTKYVPSAEEEIEIQKIYEVPNDWFDLTEERLQEAYNIGYNSEPKRLIKERKK